MVCVFSDVRAFSFIVLNLSRLFKWSFIVSSDVIHYMIGVLCILDEIQSVIGPTLYFEM